MEISQAAILFAALSQETRLKIVRVLVAFGRDGLAAGRLAEEVGVAPSNLSFHLKELQHAGLITARRTGRSVIYSVSFDTLSRLIGFLGENCCAQG